MRPPVHSLLVHVDRESPSSLSIEFNDQGNTRLISEIESFTLVRESLRIRVKPGTELCSVRVTYVRSRDPFPSEENPEPQLIRGVHVTFAYEQSTYEEIRNALAAIGEDWLHLGS